VKVVVVSIEILCVLIGLGGENETIGEETILKKEENKNETEES
jgi:hypothetical protein